MHHMPMWIFSLVGISNNTGWDISTFITYKKILKLNASVNIQLIQWKIISEKGRKKNER